MNLWQSVLEALESLNNNKLRSSLTILGIVIGVGAVIAMVSVGQGAQNEITGMISGIGTNLIFVVSGNQQVEIRNPKSLTGGDANAIQDPFLASSVINAAPLISTSASVTAGSKRTEPSIDGITPEYQSVRNYALTEGEFINTEHVLGRASVAVVGPDLADRLFDRHDGVTGETIRISGQPFRIIGVLESKGGGAFGNQDNVALLPLSTVRARLVKRKLDQVDMIMVQAASADVVPQASDEITQILRSRHQTGLGEDDFTIMTQQDFVATANTITGVFTIFLGGIAGISLLVGGIGIMNIMLVSVTERTREIGLRKALGARRRDILIQFLTESSLLSLIGGIIGIGLGWLICFIIGQIAAANETPFNPEVSSQSILLATVFSTMVGLFFGIYPANRAARLEPVEALRYE